MIHRAKEPVSTGYMIKFDLICFFIYFWTPSTSTKKSSFKSIKPPSFVIQPSGLIGLPNIGLLKAYLSGIYAITDLFTSKSGSLTCACYKYENPKIILNIHMERDMLCTLYISVTQLLVIPKLIPKQLGLLFSNILLAGLTYVCAFRGSRPTAES